MSRIQQLLADAKQHINEVSVDDVKQSLEQQDDMVLIDTREDHEWQVDHLPGAKHLSRGKLEFMIENTVPDTQQKIVLYCRSGGRSALAADSLQKMGYNNVFSMAGGHGAWTAAGYPTETD